MEKSKIKIEIYEGDPFGSTCCGPGPLVTSMAAVERLRKMLTERNETVRRLSEEYKDTITINREIISQKRLDYPEHVRKLMFDGKPLPYIFINEEPVLTGKFPTYEEFAALLKARL
jgi:Fe-S oxidoreductase